MIRLVDTEICESNIWLCLRERGKIVPNSRREGHNVFTVTGRNLLAKLMAWYSMVPDTAYTQRRPRWIGVGSGAQLEVSTVTQLVTPVLAKASPAHYLVPLSAPPSFPTSTSVQYAYNFLTSEITTGGAPVIVSEIGLFADILGANTYGGTEDSEVGGGVTTTLDPAVGTNPPISYKAFEPFTKTVDFTLDVRWTYRF